MSPQTQGTDTTIDSNIDVVTLRSAPVTLAAGENNPTIDAGFFIDNPKASIVKKWTAPAPLSYKIGDTLSFEIVVTNEGNVPVTSYNVVDDSFASAATGLTCTPAIGDVTIAIPVGGSNTHTCTAIVSPTATGQLTNTATLAAKGTDKLDIVAPKTTNPQSDGNTTTALDTSLDAIKASPALASLINTPTVVNNPTIVNTPTVRTGGNMDLNIILFIQIMMLCLVALKRKLTIEK